MALPEQRTLEKAGIELRQQANRHVDMFNVGRYIDRVRSTPQDMKFESRLCIYDTEMIPNSIIYPI